MKILILTQPLGHNYGGILQAWALQQVLKRMGHDVVTDNPLLLYEGFVNRYITLCKSIINRVIGRTSGDPFWYQKVSCKYSKSIDFCSREINMICLNKKTVFNDFDCIIVGSDQVWRPAYNTDQMKYFLDFVESYDVRRISYAASFGLSDLSEYSIASVDKVRSLLGKFDHVSVREKEAVEICSKYFNKNATHVLDPTILLDTSLYMPLLDNSTIMPEEYVLAYFLDLNKEKELICKNIAQLLELPVISLLNTADKKYPSVGKWMSMIKHARYVVTDSFHGVVFSILFKRRFSVMKNLSRGHSRFDSLLSMFGLENREIQDVNINLVEHINFKIDYEQINEIIQQERLISMSYLKKSLE